MFCAIIFKEKKGILRNTCSGKIKGPIPLIHIISPVMRIKQRIKNTTEANPVSNAAETVSAVIKAMRSRQVFPGYIHQAGYWARVGVRAIVPGAAWVKTLAFIVLSPLIGMLAGFLLMVAVSWIFRNTPYGNVDRWFRRAQLLSAAAFSLSHGTNDAQKTMGIIAGLLVANRAIVRGPGSTLFTGCTFRT